MHPLLLLLNLAAAVLLLLWAVRMVRTGMERAFGTQLRDTLRRSEGSTVGMAGVGVVLAVMLQSATAVGLLSASFVARGLLGGAAALAALIGADLGSALVVWVLALDLSSLIPALLVIGVVMFLKFERRSIRQVGRIILGIGFVLLSLQMIGQATEPLRESESLPAAIGYLQGDPLTAFVIVALLTWGMHSSVAMVLLLAALAQQGLLPMQAAVPMVLGANFGAGLIALWLARAMPHPARRVLLGNMILRGTFSVVALLVVIMAAPDFSLLGTRPEVQLVHLHLAFNLALLIVALPLVRSILRLTALVLPDSAATPDPAHTRRTALDDSVVDKPALALASAKRELLLMGECLEEMFTPVMDILATADAGQVAALKALEEDVSARHTAVMLYIVEVNRQNLAQAEMRLGVELSDLAISFEHVGAIIMKTLLPLAEDKRKRGLKFSEDGWAEMQTMHARVRSNLQLALNVLISGDAGSAQSLMREKERMRKLERDSHDRHLTRLAQGDAESIATSHLQLEAVRAFKEINSLLVKVAHPILAEHGMILDSRLAPATL